MEALLSLDYPTRLLLAWASALLLGVALRFARKLPWHQAVGVGIMTVPLWRSVWNYVNSIQFLADPGSSLPTYSTWILSGLWSHSSLVDLGYVGAGWLLYTSGGTWNGLGSQSIRDIATKARDVGLPLRGSEGASIRLGFLAFPIFLAGTWVVNWLVYSQPAFTTGDESSVWADMTPYHTVLISLSAGLGEELVYRGVLLVLLMRVMPAWVAIIIQASVFGFAHAGYGNLAHVIVPAIFGLFAGFVALRFGIWTAIVFHVLIDVAAFGIHASANAPWFGALLVVLFMLNAGATLVWAGQWTWQRINTPRPPS